MAILKLTPTLMRHLDEGGDTPLSSMSPQTGFVGWGAQYNNYKQAKILTKFSQTALAQGIGAGRLISATLVVLQQSYNGEGKYKSLYEVTGTWGGATTGRDLQTLAYNPTQLSSVYMGKVSNAWHRFDVTGAVQKWLTGGGTTADNGFLLQDQSLVDGVTSYIPITLPGHAATSQHPYLEIVYDPNTAPTTPGTFTSPVGVLNGGSSVTVAWGPSTDAEGNLITYYPEYRYYINGVAQGWVSLVNNNSLSRLLTLSTDKTMDKIEFRVRAFDGTDYSSYRNSSVFTIGHNTIPTLTLKTGNNLTLSEAVGQNEILVDGSALDADPNNTVTIKAQFNNGTVRNLNSAISNGTTPIPFSKLFTYSDKKMFDGDTPLTVELAENVDHTLKVWAEDGQGGISTIAERKFRVIHNRPPVISDNDRDLGTLIETPSVTYQVNDLEGQAITVTEKINGQVIRTFEAEPNTDYTIEIPIEKWIPLQLQQHSLTIEAVDTIGAKSIRTFTFTRIEDTILLELKNPFITDIAASRILVTPDVYVPIGATIKIEACNNAFDAEPTWEDITGMAMNKRGYTFTNTEKTAEEWGINIRFTLEKGTASQQVRLEGFGGAFD